MKSVDAIIAVTFAGLLAFCCGGLFDATVVMPRELAATEAEAETQCAATLDDACANTCPNGGHYDGATCRCYDN